MRRRPHARRPGIPPADPARVTCITEEELGRLVRRAAAGDPAAFAEIHRVYGPAVLAAIRRRMPAALRRRYDSADLQQSVFAGALADLRGFEFRGRAEFEAWLLRKLRWKVAQRTRGVLRPEGSGPRETPLADGSRFAPEAAGDPPSAASEAAEDAEILRAAVLALDPASREVLLLHHEEGRTFAEIARRLGLASAGAVRMRYARALERLGAAWHGG